MSGYTSHSARHEDWRFGKGVDIHLGRERRGRPAGQTGAAFGATVMSTIFIVLLIVAPEQLDAARAWVRDLPIVFEVVAWMVLLPWLLAYLAWESTWPLWLRMGALFVLLGGVAQSFWRGSRSG